MDVTEFFGNFRGVCRYAREMFNRLLTVRDINSPSGTFRLQDGSDAVIRVKCLFLRLLKREESARFAFFAPDSVLHLADMYPEALLADATQQLNCDGYILRHAMSVDDGEFRRTIFYALLPNKVRASYLREISATKDMLFTMGNVKKKIVDLSLAQFNSFQAACSEAGVSFRHFHTLMTSRCHCGSLLVAL